MTGLNIRNLKMNQFTIQQMQELLEAQANLNVKYSGAGWKEDIPMSSLGAATMAELGELLESSTRIGDNKVGWKWWKTYLDNDTNNIKVEIVDMVHFTLSMLIKAYGTTDEVLDVYKTNFSEATDPGIQPPMEYILTSTSGFVMNSFCFDYNGFIIDFIYLIDSFSNFNGLSVDEMFDIYMKKNKLNHKRVDGGYKENKYKKYDENGREDNEDMFED
jgi:dimeric dUTPase (all-alpha-NTP-PPase superfamily)